MSTTAKITIKHHETGEVLNIERDVAARHPQWVHHQCGTHSEAELQSHISQCNVSDWYRGGKHLGPDECGVSMYQG